MPIEFDIDDDGYVAPQFDESRRSAFQKIYMSFGLTEKGAQLAMFATPFIFFGASIALLVWYF